VRGRARTAGRHGAEAVPAGRTREDIRVEPVQPSDQGLVESIIAWMQGFAQGPWAGVSLFAFAFAESSFFPIPPDVLLIALCFTDECLDSMGLTMWFATLCTVGSSAGGAFGYWLGRSGLRPLLTRLTSKEKIDAVERLLQKYDVWAVAAAGFTPIPYKIFTIASGLLRVKFVRFLIASVLSRGARFFLVAALCHLVGRPVRTFLEDHLNWASLAFFVLLLGGFLLVRWAVGRYKSHHADGAPGGGAS
jgi:membrane protein YqaA with SNARE-associated domain